MTNKHCESSYELLSYAAFMFISCWLHADFMRLCADFVLTLSLLYPVAHCRRRLTRPGIITSSCCSATPRRRARRTRARGTLPRSTKPSRLSRTLAKRFSPRFSITRLKLMSELSSPTRKIYFVVRKDIYYLYFFFWKNLFTKIND